MSEVKVVYEKEEDPWLPLVEDWLSCTYRGDPQPHEERTTTRALTEAIGMLAHRMTREHAQRMAAVFVQLGYAPHSVKGHRVWRKGEVSE